jgi:two-component system chemotaxis response regulator CheB
MVQIQEGNLIRFRCHTGHAFSMQSLLAEINETIDKHLWSTIRAVDERVFLLQQMAKVAKSKEEAAQCLAQARQSEERVNVLRQIVLDTDDFGHDPAELPAQKQPTPAREASNENRSRE